ncbi:hypothetical protein [Allorhodopirellula solitaria]|uniref:Uncharacterized protein n=1 Tax=Allorhodopirellula solitaria TaxID=2527987 RepID=A0A5C5X1V6_9BACT|nr:hypothetical protein [Allorhodopirellula solitaria]TWT56589.1 hypothetical protein CA85_41230 [Allorhodopirellula solitaria]
MSSVLDDPADQWMNDEQTRDGELEGEHGRFCMIFRHYAAASGDRRRELRNELLEYLKFSPQSESLITELIALAVDHHSPDRLYLAIDILPQLGDRLFEYAHTFLIRDVDRWNQVYSSRAYEPDDDYWFVLLRSVGQADIAEATKLMFITSCLIESNRGIAEAVVEALGDIDSGAAYDALRRLTTEQDRFIAELTQNALDE